MRPLLLLCFLALATACDPSYSCYVLNNSGSPLYLKTHPSIESAFDRQAAYYDSAINHKVGPESSFYRVKPGELFLIFGRIGFSPSVHEVPFDYLEIIQNGDTLVLDGKQKIYDRLVQEGKSRKYIIQHLNN
jgi:hypothetical protein